MALYRGDTKVSGIGQSFNPENTGTEGQVLTKTNSGYAYCDVPEEIPSGGTEGQVLTKTADGWAWCDSQSGGLQAHLIKYIVVGGGGGGGFYGGGGGGAVCFGGNLGQGDSYTVVIGCGGTKGYYCGEVQPTKGGDSCLLGFFEVVAKGGDVGVQNGTAGKSGSGFAGYLGINCSVANPTSSGGGAGGEGKYCCTSGGCCGSVGGAGICGYGGGGGGYYAYNLIWENGGEGGGRGSHYSGNAQYPCNGCDARNCGGGGGAMYSTGMTNNYGGAGGPGLVEVCYKADGSSGIKTATGGDCCYVCDGYCVHRFTTVGTSTFCITG